MWQNISPSLFCFSLALTFHFKSKSSNKAFPELLLGMTLWEVPDGVPFLIYCLGPENPIWLSAWDSIKTTEYVRKKLGVGVKVDVQLRIFKIENMTKTEIISNKMILGRVGKSPDARWRWHLVLATRRQWVQVYAAEFGHWLSCVLSHVLNLCVMLFFPTI